MPGSGIINIRAYADAASQNKPVDGISPLQVAAGLHDYATQTLKIVNEMPEKVTDKELRMTLGDLNAMAHLGNYYADKILGATDLALYNATGDSGQQQSSMKHLEAALQEWKQYAAIATAQYRPQLLTRIGYVDLNALTAKVEQDIEIARNWKRSP
jgi:hypothetical protein